jgi:hypothetical protein
MRTRTLTCCVAQLLVAQDRSSPLGFPLVCPSTRTHALEIHLTGAGYTSSTATPPSFS